MKTDKLIYIHIPRTAGTHFEKALGFKGHDKAPRCGSVAYGANYNEIMGWDKRTRIMLQHATYKELVKNRFIDPNNDLIKVTIVRNPYHRAISLFKYFGGESKWKNFENFLSQLEKGTINGYFYMPQWKYIHGGKFDVIKFENFLPDIEAFKNKHSLKFNISFKGEELAEKSKRAFNKYYKSQDVLNRVESLYMKDFDLFDYLLVG